MELARSNHRGNEPDGLEARNRSGRRGGNGGAQEALDFPRQQFDRVIAVFMVSYLSCAEMTAVFRTVRSRLAPGGRFVFTVPHPFLPYIRPLEKPVYFDSKGRDYFAGVNQSYEGYIWRRDGHAKRF